MRHSCLQIGPRSMLEVQLYLYVDCAPGAGVGKSGQGEGCDGGVPSAPLLPPSPLWRSQGPTLDAVTLSLLAFPWTHRELPFPLPFPSTSIAAQTRSHCSVGFRQAVLQYIAL